MQEYIVCIYCGKPCKNANSHRNHERLCKSNPNRQQSNLKLHDYVRHNAVTKAKLEGRVPPPNPNTGKAGWFRGHKHTSETRRKISLAKRALYASGFAATAGRCPKLKHTSPVAGEISVDGTWELAVARWLDSQGLTWRRNTKRFEYTKPNGANSTYCPDFYVEDWKSYIEVKGYETELDRCKWSQFPGELLVWKLGELKDRGIAFRSNGSAVV